MYPTTLDMHSKLSAPLKLELVTQPAIEPVSVNELVDFLRLPQLDDIALVTSLGIVARQYIEQVTRQTLITQTFNLWLDFFPSSILIPVVPFQSVSFIQWTDQGGIVETLDPSKYEVDTKGTRPVIVPPLGYFFPIAKVQYPNAVQVQFTAGYGDDPSDVPESFKLMIKQMVALNYNAREAVVMGQTPAIVPHTFDSLLRINKVWGF
jgi:uncharacterized phiE125 gp8 family phage protein